MGIRNTAGPSLFFTFCLSFVLLYSQLPLVFAIDRDKTDAAQPVASVAKVNGGIAFSSFRTGNSEIFSMNADGSSPMQLTNNVAFDGEPSWSPDGRRIVFTSTRDGNEEIYLMNADGSGQTRLTNNPAFDHTPVWSPDGAQIAFASTRDSENFDIFVMNSDGSGQTNISKGTAADFQDPDWSPDGTKIACSEAAVTNGVRGIYGVLVMNADGTNQIKLSSPNNVDITPRWSPDGSRIAFTSSRLGDLGTFEVYVMSSTGTNQIRLTNAFKENSRPVWSPDGTKLSFQSNQRFTFDIFVINADGSGQVNLSDNLFDEFYPAWRVDQSTAGNPIDDPTLFVRRHYLDFLNREPDAEGLQYWSSQIQSCGSDAVCIKNRRLGVSAAFFVEQEFQQTGFFVEKFYAASFCRRPTFVEFNADRQVVVAGPNLESNKLTFALEFVQRNEFVQKYPTALPGPGFVDALLTTIRACNGVDLSPERDNLITQYNRGGNQAQSRANVLRLVVDDLTFSASEYNHAFVLAAYFGYLRRDPDEAGFQFWLDVLNNRVPNNYLAMVCAFITSAEYQRRFSTILTHSNAECAP